MILRPFLATDAAAAHDLHRACFPDPWPAEAFTTLLASGAFGFCVTEDDGLSGFILARSVCEEAEILTFAVNPPLRRQGIGAALLAQIIAALATTPVKQLFLEVSEHNLAASTLYKKLGFTVIGERTGYYRDNDGLKTATVMMRIVTMDKVI